MREVVLLGIFVCVSSSFVGYSAAQDTAKPTPRPLSHAHAHNDYEHDRPLLDALDHGFTSVEADIFLIDGELRVAHFITGAKPGRTLESLYLKPLYERFQQNKGNIYPKGGQFTLLVDIKNKGTETYEVLAKQLLPYAEMLSITEGNKHTPKAVTIIISGDRPIEAIKSSNPRYVGIDGRLTDLNSDEPPSLYPLISDNWRIHFSYRGTDPMLEAEREKLQQIVRNAHTKGRRIRFWATPEADAVWDELRKAKVDLIGTDDLGRLRTYLTEQR